MSKIYLAEKSQLDNIGGSFCTCSTAAATAAKTASLSNFTMKTGAQVAVKFTYANTASSPTLNINGTGAKSIYYHNSAVPVAMLMAGGVYLMVYDGSRWQLMGNHFECGNNANLGALQFYNTLKNSYYSGNRLTFSGSSGEEYFESPHTSNSTGGSSYATSCYGKINFGQYVKQGYKKLLITTISNSFNSGYGYFYISTSSGTSYDNTSGAVASASFERQYSSSFETTAATCLLDISNLSGSYYFIVIARKGSGSSAFYFMARNVYLLT